MKIHRLKLGTISFNDTYFSTGYIIPLIIEILINMVFLPPLVEGVYRIKGSIYVHYRYDYLFNFNNINNYGKDANPNLEDALIDNEKTPVLIVYGVSNVITIFILLRSYHFIRVIHTFSYWST